MPGDPVKNEDALWREIDRCRTDRSGLSIAIAKTDGKVDLLESRLNAISQAMTDHRAESKETLAKIEVSLRAITEKIETISLEAAQNRGAGVSRREVFAWVCGAAVLIVSLIAIAKHLT